MMDVIKVLTVLLMLLGRLLQYTCNVNLQLL